MDGIHDMGAMHGFGPIPIGETGHGPEWGARMQVVGMLSGGSRRSQIEALPPDVYLAASYHERWLLAAERSLLEKGTIRSDDLARWSETLAADKGAMPHTEDAAKTTQLEAKVMATPMLFPIRDQRFGVGDPVRVKHMRPEPHHRCPRYVRGVVGQVEKVPGGDYIPHLAPDANETETIYTVRFDSVDLWGDRSAEGEPPYELFIDLWQSYLEPV